MSNHNAASGNKGERSTESTGTGHLEVLTEMADKFNPDEAKKLAEQNKPKNTEKTPDDAKFTYLAVMPEKQEKELSPQDAANEYLSLLDELSKDFVNPYYKDGSGQSHHPNSSLARELGKKYSNNPHYRSRGKNYSEAGVDRTLYRMEAVDVILRAELGWRNGGEQLKKAYEKIDQKISNLDNEYAKKGRIGKFFGKRKYERSRKSLESSKRDAENQFMREKLPGTYGHSYNDIIMDELAISYDETGNRGSRFGVRGYATREAKDTKNEEYNRRFFGLDDPERAAKIERAIELRQKYEAEWSKKK